MRFNKLLATGMAVTIAASTVLGGCSSNKDSVAGESTQTGQTTAAEESPSGEIEKPEKITIMVNGTVTTKVNNRDAFEKRWEELTGIDLEFIQPDHDAYYDVMGQTFASGVENWPDAIIFGGSYYTGYAEEGALWDMTRGRILS